MPAAAAAPPPDTTKRRSRRSRRGAVDAPPAEPVVVSMRREAGDHALSAFVAHGFTLRAGEHVQLDPVKDAVLINDLRRWGLSDAAGHCFGEPGFQPRHEIVTRSEFDRRVEAARSRLSASARIAADQAALSAAEREVAKGGDPTDLKLVNARIARRGAP